MAGVPPGSSIGLSHHKLLSLSLLALVVGGCGDTIALGSECPPFGDQCIEPRPRDQFGDGADAAWSGSPPADAAVPSAPQPDSQVVDSGGRGPGLFPAFQNPSFDITAGSRIGGLISTFAVQSSPWLSCSPPGRGPGVYPQADPRTMPVGEPDMVLTPTDGASLVNASPDGTSIAQTLGEPLVAGQPYAFVVDLAATENSTDLALAVQGGNVCFGSETLAISPPVSAGAWSSVCIRFTPTRAHGSLLLSVSSASAVTGTRVFIDNIRAEPTCL